jgi:hypothetical protein
MATTYQSLDGIAVVALIHERAPLPPPPSEFVITELWRQSMREPMGTRH